ncbi:hypothetical protein LEP1GSC125_2226 [Leptospira mayottensis 200901122]|uniref:Uncharacterized protein n=1 Tax=Leptospira mayottensis 200901122 TaxID=1193010 RepID=A0AA87MSB1_9LEPT|nr:hypothetical protein LEP1GSC125_2226 [Leptospira mayottensis 200901122]
MALLNSVDFGFKSRNNFLRIHEVRIFASNILRFSAGSLE